MDRQCQYCTNYLESHNPFATYDIIVDGKCLAIKRFYHDSLITVSAVDGKGCSKFEPLERVAKMHEPKLTPAKKTLREIVDEFARVLVDIDTELGVLDIELEERLSAVEAELADKVDACVLASDRIASTADVYRARASSMESMARALENRSKRLRVYVLGEMQRLGVDKLSTEHYPSVSLRRANPSVVVEPGFELAFSNDERFWRVEKKLDKKAVKAAIESGELGEFDGVRLDQSLSLVCK